MNFSNQLDSGMNTELSLSNEAKQFLLTTCKWSKFLSIVGFVSVGFLIIAAFFIGLAGSAIPNEVFEGMGVVMMLFYLLFAALYFFPILYFYRFSTMVKQGIEENSTDLLTAGFENLKSCIKFFGVLTAIVLGIYLFIFLIGIISGVGAAAF